MTHDVIGEDYVLDHRPRRGAVLTSDRKQDGKPILSVGPVVLEEIAVDEDPAGVLQLEKVLDRPRRPLVRGIPQLPGQGLREMIAPDFDVGRNKIRYGRIPAAKHHILPRPLQDRKSTRLNSSHDQIS